MKDFSKKTLDEMTLADFFELGCTLENMPKGMDSKITFTWHGKTYDDFDDMHMDVIRDYFTPTDEFMESLVGNCYMSLQSDRIVKIIGVRGDYDSKYHKEEIDEFLYEEFWKDYRGNWRVNDYSWLQEQAKADYSTEEERNKYKKWCLTPYTEMNIHSESMYMVGKDGILYVDYGCDRDYQPFRRVESSIFDKIRAEALENAKKDDSEEVDVCQND